MRERLKDDLDDHLNRAFESCYMADALVHADHNAALPLHLYDSAEHAGN